MSAQEAWGLLAALVAVLGGCSHGGAVGDAAVVREGFEPWSATRLHPALVERDPLIVAASRADETPARGAAVAGVWVFYKIYQETWSRADGPTCAFEPTCSRYALEAVAAYGPLGLPLAFGRLMRNHVHDGFYPVTAEGRLADPVRGD